METAPTELSQNGLNINGTSIEGQYTLDLFYIKQIIFICILCGQTEGPKIIVRAEEVLIVSLVLILWVGAIALFFNRWGKIRMLEPYQPKFQQQHRSSCPLVDIESLSPINHQRSSFSRMSMGISLQIPPGHFGSISGPSGPSLYAVRGMSFYYKKIQNFTT